MESFQRTVVVIACSLLGIAWVSIWWLVTKRDHGQTQWPPVVAQCPDYWSLDRLGRCVNVKDLGTCPPSMSNKAKGPHLVVDFTDNEYATTCAKYQWAQKCGVSWDGITYGVDNPCTTTSASTPHPLPVGS